MKKTTHKNRYGDIFEFEETPDGIKWTGPFEHVRVGYPNDYSKAYEAYSNDVDTDERLTLGEFINKVHEYDYKYQPGPITKKYSALVHSRMDEYNMVDPSGGPAIFVGTNMDRFGLSGVVVAIDSTGDGYLLKVN